MSQKSQSFTSIPVSIKTLTTAFIAITCLSACGQKGALYLHQKPASILTINSAQPAAPTIAPTSPGSAPAAH